MKIIKRIFILIILLILIVIACFYYAFKIEPYRVTVNSYDINQPTEGTSAIKIVQISDTHIKSDYTVDNLAKVIDKVNEQNPDIVIFSGDLYDDYATYKDDDNVIAQLSAINATYGKIAIWGNRDYGSNASNAYTRIMNNSGFILLRNENKTLTLNNGKAIMFSALDDFMLGNPVMPSTANLGNADFDMLLIHEPDPVADYLNYDYDLVLSGHSHGGQISIPFFPELTQQAAATTSLCDTYVNGMYTLNADSGEQIYVNTGIGTTHISARFNVVPEVAVFNVNL